jgi:hypothetical protein
MEPLGVAGVNEERLSDVEKRAFLEIGWNVRRQQKTEKTRPITQRDRETAELQAVRTGSRGTVSRMRSCIGIGDQLRELVQEKPPRRE